jgi:glycosyltransferase involved in cell wall biosynthesis
MILVEKVLFITNDIYINPLKREGGVRNCTFEFIGLLAKKFEVLLLPVEYKISFLYRCRVKLGLNHYNDYQPNNYKLQIRELIEKNNIKLVFLNLSNTIRFSSLFKEIGGEDIKVILCSHGNESGDYLHEVVRFREKSTKIKTLFSSYTLGRMLKTESSYRIKCIDMVLSISPTEEQIERWLGAKKTFMVPRTLQKEFLNLHPVLNRVGFIGDMSHTPNYTGVIALCDALSAKEHTIEIKLVGGPESIGQEIAKKYSFVKYCGFLQEKELVEEVATWAYFLNLVFYYSRGVSTKLAKALSWGLPVISTEAGNRGYSWEEGKLMLAKNPDDMARIIIENSGDKEKIKADQQEVKIIVETSPSLEKIMTQLYPQLQAL